jgi:hypothetical protein
MSILLRLSSLLLLSAFNAACPNRSESTAMDQDQPQHFPTLEDAVRKARQDLAGVLDSNPELRLGVDSATLARSQPGPPLRRVELDFERLLAAESTTPFDSLVKGELAVVVPLLTGDRVATVVEASRDDQGWKVVGLAGKSLADDLTIVRRAVGDTEPYGVTLYEIPNLPAQVYGVKRNGSEVLFTNYRDRFSLGKGVAGAVLIPVLKADALEFQREYGDSLRQNRLVR